ncbi:MAG TPA: hypothetical protein VMI10_18485 [Terriglobales bacterium]|nr:hypothetical protein [Terriglobales bacterium]
MSTPRSSRRSPRKIAHLPDSVRQRLHTYTLVASATGVTMLALAPRSEAEIVYTPANLEIAPIATYTLDVDNDGTTDFTFFDTYYDANGTLAVRGVPGNQVALAEGKFSRDAAAIRSGRGIGPRARFGGSGYSVMMASGWYNVYFPYNFRCAGPWKDKQNRYLGLKFMIGGEVHYGWARLSETCDRGNRNSALLTGYAYETIANKKIKAGQEQGTDDGIGQPDTPASDDATPNLGALAQGARGLRYWRRNEQAAKRQDVP